MQDASLRLSGTDQREERDGQERLSQESTPSRFNQTHTPTSSRKDVHAPFLPLEWLQNSLTAYLILSTTKKSTSSRNPFSETHCQVQKRRLA